MHCNHLLIRNWKVKGSTVNSRLCSIYVSTKQSAVFDLKSMCLFASAVPGVVIIVKEDVLKM